MDLVQRILARIDLGAVAGLGTALQNPSGLFAMLALVVVVLYGVSVGKTKALVSLLAVYVAYMLTVMFPFLTWLGRRIVLPDTAPILNVVVFFVLYLATFLTLSHSIMKSRLTLGEISITKVVLISIVQLGLMASIVISLLPTDFAARTFGIAYPYLAGPRILWIWAAASLAVMPFMKSHPRQ